MLIVDAFELRAGDRSFTPRGSIEFDGLAPAPFVSLADQIQVDGDVVSFLRLYAGGLLSASDADVSFRTFEFRADEMDGGEAVGQLGDGPQPRRLHLEGTLFQVDQTFLVPDSCPPQPVSRPGGGGIVIGVGDRSIISYDSFDILPSESVQFNSPLVGGALNRVMGDVSVIGGRLLGSGSVVLLNPGGVVFGPTGANSTLSLLAATPEPVGTRSSHPIPTLEELGIIAPAGAEVIFDASGALRITSEGDLFIVGDPWDLPGLTSVSIVTSGSVTV